jgi:hypothetical protein
MPFATGFRDQYPHAKKEFFAPARTHAINKDRADSIYDEARTYRGFDRLAMIIHPPARWPQ